MYVKSISPPQLQAFFGLFSRILILHPTTKKSHEIISENRMFQLYNDYCISNFVEFQDEREYTPICMKRQTPILIVIFSS